jgi:hypothetical protein
MAFRAHFGQIPPIIVKNVAKNVVEYYTYASRLNNV